MEEKLNINRLTIRHYKNKDLYNQYANVRKDSDINIIGDSMTVYGTSVVDEEINSLKENISNNDQNIRRFVNDSISSCNNDITTLQNNTYSKLEVDNKEEAIKKDVSEQINQVVTQIPNSLPANGGNADTAKQLLTARTIKLAGKAFSYSESFDGSKNITINVNRVTDAEKLTNSRQITLSGDVSGSAYFNGSSNININVNSRHSAHASNADNAGYANWANWAKGANALAGNEALYNYLHRHNNTTIPKTNVELNKLGIFARYFAGWGQIDNQPTEWGQLINFPAGMDSDESCQLWLQQDNGKLWHRGGNPVNPVNNRQFVRFLDTEDISGNVSNSNSWWVKINGKIPLIIQGGKRLGEPKNYSFTYPLQMSTILSVHVQRIGFHWAFTPRVQSVTNTKVTWDYTDQNDNVFRLDSFVIVIGC